MQAGLIRDLTADVLRRAGIGPAMRVLDIGCGVGDVSLLAADMVGPSGFVLGIDRSADAIAVAERRAVAAGKCYWTRFAATEIDEFSAHETFDAVIGRLILMYLPDPAATLKRLSSHLRPDGVVAFQEIAMTAARCVPEGSQFQPIPAPGRYSLTRTCANASTGCAANAATFALNGVRKSGIGGASTTRRWSKS